MVVDYEDPIFTIRFPYNQELVEIVKNLPVREFRKKTLAWEIPQLAISTLDNFDAVWTEKAQEMRRAIKAGLVHLVDQKYRDYAPHDKLRPYQVVGSNFIQMGKKVLLCDDMGLGKTIQSIHAMESVGLNKVLVLCPASLKWNWERQFLEHFNIQPVIISGGKKEREQQWKEDAKYFICNYELLNFDWNFMPRQWDGIIADEVVYLKNHSAGRTKRAKRLKARYKIGLSGFPLEKNLLEFHSIFDWIRPGLLPSFWRFRQRYLELDWAGAIIGYKNLAELHTYTTPFILRRTKDKVLKDLPPKITTDYPLEMDSKADKAYQTLLDGFMGWMEESKGDDTFTIQSALEKMIRLRQFVEFPEIVNFHDVTNTKLEWLKEIYDGVDKLVVFTEFKTSLNLLAKEFKTEYLISGDVAQKKRLPTVQAFNDADKAILISTGAGKFGLDIVGADNIVHYGYFYNPATMLQREDRLHRIGQTKVVNVLRPFIKNTVDEGIMELYLSRLKDIQSFMDGSDMMSQAKMKRSDFIKIVTGRYKRGASM